MNALFLSLSFLAAAPVSGQAPPWPLCSIRSDEPGGPAIVVNEQVLPPIFFCGNNQFGRDEVLIETLELAAQAGIPFFVFEWRANGTDGLEVLRRFCEAHPTGYFYLRIWIGPERSWLDAHPEERIVDAGGKRSMFVSPASEAGREHVSELLRGRLRLVLESPYADHFIGAAVQYLHTAEWFYPDLNHFTDYSAPNRRAFQRWLKARYGTDEALQAAWGQPETTLDTASLPLPKMRDAAAWGPFRDPVKQRPAADMTRFQSELVADTIAYYCKVVKEVTRGRSLAGAFYGYTHELNNNGPRALAHSGHLALGRLLDCPDVDIIQAPYSYFERGLGAPGHFHLPVDSLALHGKLAIMEEDSYTHLAAPPGKGMVAPGWRERTKSLAETVALTERNYGNFLTHRAGFWFFDLLSDGRWNDAAFWKSTELAQTLARHVQAQPAFAPEIAFLADELSVDALRDTTGPELTHALSYWRAEMDRLGMPVGYYLQSDLNRLPESVKVIVFANAYRIDDATRPAVARLLARGATVIWTYAAGLVGEKGPDVANVARLTGFPVEARFDDAPIHLRDGADGRVYAISDKPWRVRFTVGDGPQDILARYDTTDEALAVSRVEGHGRVIYTATPRLPLTILRRIASEAGVHRYRQAPGMTAVVGDYLIIHGSAGAKPAAKETFTWPEPLSKVTRIRPDQREIPLDADARTWQDVVAPNTTVVYHCQP